MVEMPFDEVILSRSQIMLPAAMRTRLEPDKWKPYSGFGSPPVKIVT
jgi:hypothetical protein